MSVDPISAKDFELTEWRRAEAESGVHGYPKAQQEILEILTGEELSTSTKSPPDALVS